MLSEDLLATSTRRPARRMARWSAMSQSAVSAAERGAGLPGRGGGGGPGLAPQNTGCRHPAPRSLAL